MNGARWCPVAFLALFAGACGTDVSLLGEGGASRSDSVSLNGGGNGAPSGAHFTLNVIGMAKPKSGSFEGGGSRIFVLLNGATKILLQEGPFQVIDPNGTDGSASFQLPNPDPENDGTTTYSVFVRALGKPGGHSTMTPCATDVVTGEEYCSVESVVSVRTGGKSRFTNVSRSLLYVYADLDGDGQAERYNLFSDAMRDYYWNYDNAGLRIAQLRFYPISTTLP